MSVTRHSRTNLSRQTTISTIWQSTNQNSYGKSPRKFLLEAAFVELVIPCCVEQIVVLVRLNKKMQHSKFEK